VDEMLIPVVDMLHAIMLLAFRTQLSQVVVMEPERGATLVRVYVKLAAFAKGMPMNATITAAIIVNQPLCMIDGNLYIAPPQEGCFASRLVGIVYAAACPISP